MLVVHRGKPVFTITADSGVLLKGQEDGGEELGEGTYAIEQSENEAGEASAKAIAVTSDGDGGWTEVDGATAVMLDVDSAAQLVAGEIESSPNVSGYLSPSELDCKR